MEEAQQGGQTIEERLQALEEAEARLVRLEARKRSSWAYTVDDLGRRLIKRMTWKGVHDFLKTAVLAALLLEGMTDGPNGAVEQLLEGALRTFGGGG